MERLEVSIISFSKILEVETNRLDSDYYKKRYIKLLNKIESQKNNFKQFNDLKLKVDASAFYPSLEPYYNSGDFPFLRVADVNTNIDYEGCVRVPREIIEADNFNTLKIIDEGDIIITKGGSIARVGLIEQKTAVTRDLIFVNSSTLSKIDYKFLFLYLMSNVSYDLLIRSSSMTAQPHLTIKLVKDLPLFTASNHFKIEVTKIFDISKEKLTRSKFLYTQAETLLLQEIGLETDQLPSKQKVEGSNPSEIKSVLVSSTRGNPIEQKKIEGSNPSEITNINVKSFKESFGVTGRLDAEYYQKKYEEYEELVIENKNGYSYIKNEFEHITNTSKKEKSGYNYIEIGDINVSDGSCSFNYVLTEDLPANAKTIVKKGDILISNVRPYRGAVAIIDFEIEDLIVSGAFTVLRENEKAKFTNEVLKVLLRTNTYKDWLLKFNVGTSYPVIKDVDVLNLPIPFISVEVQKRISQKVQESQTLKKQSEQLLEVAKKAVEIAIEEDEEVAMEFINENVK